VSSGALLARIVEQPLRDIPPDRVAAVQADRVGGLDFHGPLAAAANPHSQIHGLAGPPTTFRSYADENRIAA
jgi:hypothetical protein